MGGTRLRRLLHRRGKGSAAPMFIAILVLLLFVLFWRRVDLWLRPAVEQMAMSRASNRVVLLVNSAVSACVEQAGLTYEDFVTVKTDETGQITSITSDLASVTWLKSQVAGEIVAGIDELREETFGIPVGTLTGWVVFSGKGPVIRVELLSLGETDLQLRHEFDAAGINQTVHRIWLDAMVTMELMIPGGILSRRVGSSVCIAETVIVGEVPETYLNFGTGE